MTLVDLRGREDEDAVRSLLAVAHGSPAHEEEALDRYRSGEWRLVGWSESDEVVACAGVSRDDDRSVVLHAVGVAPAWQGRGVDVELVHAVAALASSHRLLAETDANGAELYRACGFAISDSANGRCVCVLELAVTPATAAAVSAVTLEQVEQAIRASWSRETSDNPDEWTEDSPARGQCVGTALLVRELLGGEILLADVIRDGQWVERHAWNRLTTGVAVDLTRSQFVHGELLGEPAPGEPLHPQGARYELLAARVRGRLAALVA
jgi:GNAT superfamily N-acetyltransferase